MFSLIKSLGTILEQYFSDSNSMGMNFARCYVKVLQPILYMTVNHTLFIFVLLCKQKTFKG